MGSGEGLGSIEEELWGLRSLRGLTRLRVLRVLRGFNEVIRVNRMFEVVMGLIGSVWAGKGELELICFGIRLLINEDSFWKLG